jgi:hypothetical protein
LVHEGQIRIETLPDGSWRFLHPDGRHFEVIRRTHSPAVEWEDLKDMHAELGIHIDSRTAATRWRGERMDYELGVWVLCNQANRARRTKNGVPAVTSDMATSNTATPVTAPWPEEDGEWWKPGYRERADNDASAEVGVPAGTSDAETSDTETSDAQSLVTVPLPDTSEWWRPGYGERAA